MYARLSMLRLHSNTPKELQEQWARDTQTAHGTLQGFKSLTFLGESSSNEYASISFWETEQDAFEAGDILASKVYSSIPKTYIESAPVTIIYGVYTPT